jgi:hypothetical protein
VEVADHAHRRWAERVIDSDDVPVDDQDVDDAWREAVPMQRGDIFSAMYSRYHARSDCVLLAHRERLLTVLYADGEDPGEVAQARHKADRHRARGRLRGADTS